MGKPLRNDLTITVAGSGGHFSFDKGMAFKKGLDHDRNRNSTGNNVSVSGNYKDPPTIKILSIPLQHKEDVWIGAASSQNSLP